MANAAVVAAAVGAAGLVVTASAVLVLTIRVLGAERRAVVPADVGRAQRRTHERASTARTGESAADGPDRRRLPVVVFGSRAFPGRPGLELQARLDHAFELWETGTGGPVVVTGGTDGAVDEVAEMRRYLLRRGMPAEEVVEARPGQNTRASIDAVTRMRSRLGPSPWVAVSTPFHAYRIAVEFRRHGIAVIVSGPQQSPEMRDARTHGVRVATEVVASAAYALPRGWLARIDTAPGSWRHTLPRVLAGRGRYGSRRRSPPGTRRGAGAGSPPTLGP